jgi:hypothetical protein
MASTFYTDGAGAYDLHRDGNTGDLVVVGLCTRTTYTSPTNYVFTTGKPRRQPVNRETPARQTLEDK